MTRSRSRQTVFDFGEWSSEVASRKNPDGTISFVTIVPGFSGLEFVAGDRTLTLRDAQHEYVLKALSQPARLTCDHMVTYCSAVSNDDDLTFKALADTTRRFLLDLLFARDGRTLTELESELEMSRFGVMKHLRVLERAGLVVTRKSGREKLHFLNPVPIRGIYDRWTRKYAEPFVSALVELKTDLEERKCRPSRKRA